MLNQYLKRLYQRTMTEAYGLAEREISSALATAARCLECGAADGAMFERLSAGPGLTLERYTGIEWNPGAVAAAQAKGIPVRQGDLNQPVDAEDGSFDCVFALSVLEHLLNPCRFMSECHRLLAPGGRLILLTPNISTYFTAAMILAGRMPSSGPHPDSNNLIRSGAPVQVSAEHGSSDVEGANSQHRHLVVFSYLVLRRYLRELGFREVRGRAFGLYPFPNFAQPVLERLDPWHCHQMVFVAVK